MLKVYEEEATNAVFTALLSRERERERENERERANLSTRAISYNIISQTEHKEIMGVLANVRLWRGSNICSIQTASETEMHYIIL